MRRKGSDIHLITVGLQTYSSDSRYSIEFKEPNDWQLLIQYANERDEGIYECQISSHPPLVYVVYLTVIGKYKKYSEKKTFLFKLFFFLQNTFKLFFTLKNFIKFKCLSYFFSSVYFSKLL